MYYNEETMIQVPYVKLVTGGFIDCRLYKNGLVWIKLENKYLPNDSLSLYNSSYIYSGIIKKDGKLYYDLFIIGIPHKTIPARDLVLLYFPNAQEEDFTFIKQQEENYVKGGKTAMSNNKFKPNDKVSVCTNEQSFVYGTIVGIQDTGKYGVEIIIPNYISKNGMVHLDYNNKNPISTIVLNIEEKYIDFADLNTYI